VLEDFGAIQEVPAALADVTMGQCLSVAKRDGTHCSGGGGFGRGLGVLMGDFCEQKHRKTHMKKRTVVNFGLL
jgi:hypothetical protein